MLNDERLRLSDVFTGLLFLGLLFVLAHASLSFMDLEAPGRVWFAFLGLSTLIGLSVGFANQAKHAVLLLMASFTVWALSSLANNTSLAQGIVSFSARWGIFLQDSVSGSLRNVPEDLGFFSIALLLLGFSLLGAIGIKRSLPWLILPLGLTWLMIQWFFFFDSIPYLRVFIVLSLVFLALVEGRRWEIRRDAKVLAGFRRVGVVTSVLVLSLLVMTVTAIIPGDSAIWSLRHLREWFVEQVPSLDRLRGTTPTGGTRTRWYSLSTSGYGSSDELGGPIELDPTPAFSITIESHGYVGDRIPFPLYLQGRTLTRYTGRGWTSASGEEWEWYRLGQYMPRTLPLRIPSGRFSIDIYDLQLQSHTIFGAGDIREVVIRDSLEESPEEVVGKNQYGNVVINHPDAWQRPYRVMSQVPYWSLGERQFEPLEVDFSLNRYLQVPGNVPGRVIDLAQTITAEAENDFERAQLLVHFLRSFPYSLDPSAPPADVDFVDHFLFEEQTGYCTYHSSALALMLRLLDIPSRWVQGFALSSNDLTRMEDSSSPQWHGEVLNSRAHAWVEAWIPEYGWMTFEATPNYDAVDHSRTLDLPTSNGSGTDASGTPLDPDLAFDPDFDPDMMYEEDFMNGMGSGPVQDRNLWLFRLISVVLFIGLMGTVGSARYLSQQRETAFTDGAVHRLLSNEADSTRAQIVRDTNLIFFLLHRALGIAYQGYTPREFVARILGVAPQFTSTLESILPVYEEAIFGTGEISGGDVEMVDEAVNQTQEHIRKSLGLMHYFRTRYGLKGAAAIPRKYQ